MGVSQVNKARDSLVLKGVNRHAVRAPVVDLEEPEGAENLITASIHGCDMRLWGSLWGTDAFSSGARERS